MNIAELPEEETAIPASWSDEALEQSQLKRLTQRHKNFNVTGLARSVNGFSVQTDIPEGMNGPGKWLWIGWIKLA